MTTRMELWQRLAAAGIVSGTPPADDGTASPWYVNAMIGVAAWIASLFIVAFLTVLIHGLLRDRPAAIFAGAVLCVASVLILRIRSAPLFVTQMAIAMSLAGQALMAYGLLHGHMDDAGPWLALVAVETVLVVAAPNALHRTLATIAASCALYFTLRATNLVALFPALVAGAFVLGHVLQRASAREALWSAVSAGLAVGALLGVPVMLADLMWWRSHDIVPMMPIAAWIGAVALVAVLLAAIARLLRECGVAPGSRIGIASLAAGAVVGVAAWPLPGVVVAAIVLLVAYASGRIALAGLAVAALLLAIGHYYYAMEVTLLVKSAALFAIGVVLLASGLAVRFVAGSEGGRHA